MDEQPGVWQDPQKILVILAHPDDPEFFCGATLARWARAGHEIHYLLLTCGDKGFDEPNAASVQICKVRHAEQNAAAVHYWREISSLFGSGGWLPYPHPRVAT